MRTHSTSRFSRSRRKDQRGIALITALLLLMLLTALSVAMVLSVSSDTLVNGYYRNFRGSFYASDSGVNIAREAMVNDINAAVVGGWGPAVAPIPAGTTTTVQTAVLAAYGNGKITILNGGQSANSWPEKFTLTTATLTPYNPSGVAQNPAGCSLLNGTGTCAAPVWTKGATTTGYQYIYNYSLAAQGQSQGTEAATVTDSGTITFNATMAPGTPQTVNFAAWGMFIDQYALCGGGDLVPGTITGPVFTNGSWNFGTGNYEFTNQVQSAGTQAGYDNNGCVASSALSANGVSPKFDAGFVMGQPKIPLPANSFNQEQAVIDGIGLTSTQPTSAQLNAALKDASGTAYNKNGASSGVYLPYAVNAQTGKPTITGGGILVEGNAVVTLSAPANSTAQVFTIVNNGVTTTVTIDPAGNAGAGSTVISSPLGTQSLTGVPQQMSSNGVDEGPGTMLYVDGNITGLSGPTTAGAPAIQNASAVTITAADSVTITGSILYSKEPVQTSGTVSTGLDSLIPANNTGQVLGIFTAGGNVNLANSVNNGNLEIDASVATISQGGSGGIVNTGNSINTLTIVGGRIQNTIQNIGATTRNVLFDQRFAAGTGFAPPWFPSATVQPGVGAVTNSVTSTVQRTQWLNKTVYQ
jgi:Tfp pilus assembly protein PilX